jgi:hypothetical protein
MHKLIGQFSDENLSLILILESSHKTSKELYSRLKKYIDESMFLAFRRQSAKCKKIVLSSVGDHLSKNDEQDIMKADLFIDVEVIKELPQVTYDRLSSLDYWPIHIQLQKNNKTIEELLIRINKSDDMITHRKLVKHVTK